MSKRSRKGNTRPLALNLATLSGIYAYMYCMMASSAMLEMPILGGALYMCGQAAMVLYSICTPPLRDYYSVNLRTWSAVISGLMLLLNAALLVFYPIRLEDARVWLLLGVVLLMLLRSALGKKLIRVSVTRGMPEKRFLTLYIGSHVICVLGAAAVLFSCLSMVTAAQLCGGFALVSALEAYGQLKDRAEQRVLLEPVSPQSYFNLRERIGKINAFTSYEALSACIMVALEITLVLMYTFLSVTGEQLLTCMLLSVGCTLLAQEAADFVLRRRERRQRSDPTVMMLIGLFLWMYSLVLFGRTMESGTPQSPEAYFSLILCSLGVSVCLTVLMRMERTMVQVARFSAGNELGGYHQMRRAGTELATLVGEMIALCALTILSFAAGKNLPHNAPEFAARFQPLLVIPAMLAVIGALLGAFRFPLSQRYMDKLGRFLQLKQEGNENPALEKQLEKVVVKPHRQPFFINTLKAVLRPFFRHTLQGTENIIEDVDNPLVFLCNHGEIYGPVAAVLNIPVPIRPWTISEITVDKDEMASYVYKYTIKRQKWLPEFLKMPIAKMIGPLSVWAMGCLESIPVYRNKPRDLMNTFRMSVEALQAGDNLLIFPENPNAVAQGHGYERQGLGELFTGFEMLAPIYYNKTGKCLRFIPAFAHQKMRTLTFAPIITFDPNNEPNAERERIVSYLQETMREMYETEEAKYQQKIKKEHN